MQIPLKLRHLVRQATSSSTSATTTTFAGDTFLSLSCNSVNTTMLETTGLKTLRFTIQRQVKSMCVDETISMTCCNPVLYKVNHCEICRAVFGLMLVLIALYLLC